MGRDCSPAFLLDARGWAATMPPVQVAGELAQLVERHDGIVEVRGSIPLFSIQHRPVRCKACGSGHFKIHCSSAERQADLGP